MGFPPNAGAPAGAPPPAPMPSAPPPMGAPPVGAGGDPIAQLTPQDRQAIAAAPQAIMALKKILPPQIGMLLDAIVGNAGAGVGGVDDQGGPDDEGAEGEAPGSPPAGPQYSVPRPGTRLGSM